MTKGAIKVKGEQLSIMSNDDAEQLITGTATGDTPTTWNLKVKGTYLYWVDNDGNERNVEGTLTGDTRIAGSITVHGTYLYYGDYNGNERYTSAEPIIVFMYPVGVGSETNIPNLVGAATHWEAVLVDDDDTSYVETPATGGVPATYRDLYDMTTGLSGGVISEVLVIARVKKDQAPPLAGCSIKTHGVVYDGDLVSTAIGSYQTITTSWTTNPNTGLAWTWDEINALEAGIRLQGSKFYYERCTQLYVEVSCIG